MAREPRPKGAAAPYAVGFGKPPERTRFRKGRSGNPVGRPKGALNLGTLLEKALAERVTVKDASGRQREISKGEAALIQMVNKAAAGADPRATKLLFDLVAKLQAQGTREPDAGPGEGPPPAADRPDLSIDWSRMTTRELMVVKEGMTIIARHRLEQRPAQHPMPPTGPGGGEPDASESILRYYTPSPGWPPDDGEETG